MPKFDYKNRLRLKVFAVVLITATAIFGLIELFSHCTC